MPDAHTSQPAPDGPDRHRVELANDRDAIQAVQDQVLRAAEDAGFEKAASFAIKLALEEAIINAFKHGHKQMPPHETIIVEWIVSPDHVEIAVEDRGPGFDPERVPDPRLDENLELPSGRGLMLMRAYMSEVRHNPSGNRVEMVFRPDTRDDEDDDLFVD